MNVFRKSDDLGRRQAAEVAPNVLKLARVQNVLAVHTWDLYKLLGMKLNGEDVALSFIDALGHGGGRLVVDSDGIRVKV